jgi:hypothetical protein
MTDLTDGQPGFTGLRRCRKCGKERTVSEFRPDKKAANGRRYPRNQCRACESKDWRRDWRAGKKGRQSAMMALLRAPPAPPSDGHQGAVEGQLEEAIKHRMARFQTDALDALHDLATMPVSENSAQNQVKLLAAKLLAGTLLSPEASGDEDETNKLLLRRINEEFERNAPRLRMIRERTIAFEQEPTPSIESE